MATSKTTTGSMADRFRKAREASKKASTGGGTTLSEGRHECRLTGGGPRDGDNGKSLKWEWTCVEGDETGEKAIRWSNAGTDEQLMYLLSDLRRCGVEVDGWPEFATDKEMWDQIDAEFKALLEVGIGARITVKQNGQYLNVYLDKLLDLSDKPIPGAEATGATEEAAAEETGDEAAAEEAAAEEPAEEPAAEEVVDTIEVGSSVSFTDAKGKKFTGTVKKVLDNDSFDIMPTGGKKAVNIDASKVELMAEVG